MADRKVIAVCEQEIGAIRKIEDLKVQGVNPEYLYAVTKDADFHLLLQDRTKAEVVTAGPSMIDKIKSLMTKDKPVKDELMSLGLSEQDAQHYYQALEEDKVLLIIDKHNTSDSPLPDNSSLSPNHSLPPKEEAERRRLLQEQSKEDPSLLSGNRQNSTVQPPGHGYFF